MPHYTIVLRSILLMHYIPIKVLHIKIETCVSTQCHKQFSQSFYCGYYVCEFMGSTEGNVDTP